MAAKARPDTADRKQQSNEEAAMTGHIIRNTGSAVMVQMPSGDQVEAKSVIEALDIVDQSRSLQREGFGQINTLDFRTEAEKADQA
jgi:hypothetical protein